MRQACLLDSERKLNLLGVRAVFIWTSEYEGMPLVVIESASGEDSDIERFSKK